MTDSIFKDIDLQPVAMRDKVYEALRDAIIRGDLKAGERLVESRLAEALGASRTPLREALLKLEMEQLVIRMPGIGLKVSEIDWEELTQLYKVREVLEGLNAAEAAMKIQEKEIQELESLNNEMLNQLDAEDSARITDKGQRFHNKINIIGGNHVSNSILERLSAKIDRVKYVLVAIPGRGMDAYHEHYRLIESLKMKDPIAAESAMRAHVKHGKEQLFAYAFKK